MPFLSRSLPDGDCEVVMLEGTVYSGGPASRVQPRRFATCTHINDADTVAESLNMCEELGLLK